MAPHLSRIYSHALLLLVYYLATPLSQSWTLEGLLLIELTQRPSRALNIASCIASGTSEIQGHSQRFAKGTVENNHRQLCL